MSTDPKADPARLLQQARDWWATAIIDIRPGVNRPRGHPIQDLTGTVSFPQMIWLMLRGDLPLSGAMASAVNALDDVHGGAGEQCLSLYLRAQSLAPAGTRPPAGDAVAGGDAALDEYVVAHGKIIPGFGHRIKGPMPTTILYRYTRA